MKYSIRPISDRTAFMGGHEPSRFTVTYSDVIDLLERELDFLDARNIVIEVDVDERHIRLDGLLRADARAKSPGVRLAFTAAAGDLVYATDTFVRGPSYAYVGTGSNRRRRDTMAMDWQHNLYAIAKTLEALRMMRRYGTTNHGQQYTGFKAIGGGTAMPGPAPAMSSTVAAELLRQHGAVGDSLASCRKRALRDTHPDHGGRREDFERVQEACRVLGLT